MCRWSCLPRKRRRLSSTLWNIKRGEYQHAFFVGINVWAHPPNISTSKTVSIKLPEASLVACFKALCLKWLLLHTFALTVHDYTCYCGVQVSFFQTGKQTYTKMSLTIILDFFPQTCWAHILSIRWRYYIKSNVSATSSCKSRQVYTQR